MIIRINKNDSQKVIQGKLQEAEKKVKQLKKEEIAELKGSLKGKLKGDPVKIIRKMRDEEWS